MYISSSSAAAILGEDSEPLAVGEGPSTNVAIGTERASTLNVHATEFTPRGSDMSIRSAPGRDHYASMAQGPFPPYVGFLFKS